MHKKFDDRLRHSTKRNVSLLQVNERFDAGYNAKISKKFNANAKGFTLMEVMVVVLLISLLMGGVITSINAVTNANLRKALSMMQGLTRGIYSRAALSGKSHRIVFNFENRQFWVEEAPERVLLSAQRKEIQNGQVKMDEEDERLHNTEGSDDKEDIEKRRLFAKNTWTKIDDDEGKMHTLPGGIVFQKIWVEHLEDYVTSGQVSLTFFPGGYMQQAFIVLAEEGDNGDYMTLVTEPLLGESYIEEETPQVPSQ